MSDVLFELKEVFKIYGETKETTVHALDGVSLQIGKGEFTSIVGPSGSGKSTLLNILSGLDNCSKGSVHLSAKDLTHMQGTELSDLRRDHIGFIFQQFNLIDDLSVYENVALPLRYAQQPMSDKKIKERVDYCMDLVSMSSKAQRRPTQISGGQQQCIAIARALAVEPSILLVDEATGNLDSKRSDQIMTILEELNNQGTALCVVTHDIRYAEMAKRKVYLLDGQILGQTCPDQ